MTGSIVRLMLTLAKKPCTGSPLKMGRTMITANTAPKDSQKPPSYRLSGLHKRTAAAAAASAVGGS